MMQTLRYDWLPQRARWRHLVRSGLPAVSRNKNFPGSHTINLFLTELVWSIWLDTELFLSFGELMDLDSISVHLHLHIRDQYPAILASRLVDKPVYYMASSASGQNEPNSALWLASSGLPAVSGEKNFPESQIINPLLTKLFRSRWLDIGLVLFFQVYGPWLRLCP